MSATTRRALLRGAPVVALAAAVPAIALSDDPAGLLEAVAGTADTPILRMSRELRAVLAECDAYITANLKTLTDEDLEVLFYNRSDALEHSAADVAAKMLIAHCDGESSCLRFDHPVWVEAVALVGGIDPLPA